MRSGRVPLAEVIRHSSVTSGVVPHKCVTTLLSAVGKFSSDLTTEGTCKGRAK